MHPLAIMALTVQLVAATSYLPLQPPPGQRVTDQTLAPVLAKADKTNWAAVLGTYVRFCQTSAQPQYYVDCLSERFAYTASRMDPYNRGTADLRKVLQTAARDLSAITARYHTQDAGKATPRAANITPTRALRAIAPQNRAAASAAGTQVLDTAQLVLLRSADRDPTQALAFAQVAEVIGTAKVLLRSA